MIKVPGTMNYRYDFFFFVKYYYMRFPQPQNFKPSNPGPGSCQHTLAFLIYGF